MIEPHEQGTLIQIHVKPKAKKQSISCSPEDAECVISVKSAPIQNRANQELLKFIAKRLGISSNQVSIIRGHKTSKKTVLIEGVSPVEVKEALELA